MDNKMFGYVVLHYNNFDDTVKCVDSLLKLDGSRFIVIVDNKSPDGSGVLLEDKYKDNDNIKTILAESNTGFSKGNNIGVNYLKNMDIKFDFVCVINNDTYVEDLKFEQKIVDSYNKEYFDVLGPKIWNVRKNFNQNPFSCPANLKETKKMLKRLKRSRRALKISKYCYYMFNKIFKDKISGVTAQGAAIIFSSKIFYESKELFIEKTFMYGEESLLFHRCLKENYVIKFDYDVVIFHSDGVATSKVYTNKKKKWMFQCEKMIFAYEELLKYISE